MFCNRCKQAAALQCTKSSSVRCNGLVWLSRRLFDHFDVTNLWALLQTRALSEAPVATMFWKYNTLAVSHIDTLLDKQTVTLAEILEQEDIIQECKSQNKKLVDFLTKQEILAELLDLILQEPSEELEERLRFKLPNIASEVITCDVPQVCQTFPSLAILNPPFRRLTRSCPLTLPCWTRCTASWRVRRPSTHS